MNRLSFRSVKSQLFMMVFIMAFFAAGIIVYSGIGLRNEKIDEGMRDSALLADGLFKEQEKMVADARQLMFTLSQLPELENYHTARLRQILLKVLDANPRYSNIVIADREGRVLASAIGGKSRNLSDRRYFKNALSTGRFSAGEFITSRFTGRPVLVFGYPLKDNRRDVVCIIALGIDLTYYKTLLDTMPLPPGSSYLLLDHKGTIMTGGISAANFAGDQYETAGFRSMADGPDRDTFVAVAHDGVRRFISYRKVRLEGEQAPYMYIRAGIPVSTVLAGANRTIVRNLTLFTVSLCFIIVFISFIAKHLIVDRIALLEMASRRLAEGDMDFKVSDLVSGGELGRLGSTFDHMARKIAAREEALVESNQRYHTLFEAAGDSIFILDLEGNFVDVNRAAYERLGYTKEEMLSMNVSQLDHPDFREKIQERITHMQQYGWYKCDLAHLRKDGSVMPVEINARIMDLEGKKVIFSICRDITERKKAEKQIEASLREKEVLLKEIHHRVKNNLNIIASLLSLQSNYVTDQTMVGIFEECRNRINSMALIHERLYQTRDFSRIDFKEYLNSLISMLSSSYTDVRHKVSVSSNIQDISLDIDTAMTCGLVINELVTNCLKHAFPENRGGMIDISLLSAEGKHVLAVRDNGIGLPERFDLKNTNTLGLRMVMMLSRQLEGKMDVTVDNGTEIRVTF